VEEISAIFLAKCIAKEKMIWYHKFVEINKGEYK